MFRIGIGLIAAVGSAAGCPQLALAQLGEAPRQATMQFPATTAAGVLLIRSPADGILQQITAREGGRVKRGELLFRLDSRRQEILLNLARAGLEAAKVDYARLRRLHETKAVSEEEVARGAAAVAAAEAQAQLAETDLAERTIHAPCDGTLGELDLVPGQFIPRGTALASLILAEPLRVQWQVPQSAMGELRVGQEFEFQAGEERFTGSITFISPSLDASTRTCLVKGVLAGAVDRLRPGMFGTVSTSAKPRKSAEKQ